MKIFQRHEFEGGSVGCFEINRRRAVVVERGFPARNADAPFVAGFESGKSPLRNRRDQIVPVENRKIQKLAETQKKDS